MDTSPFEGDKKTIQRSASYPYITIESALEFASKLKLSFPTSRFTREDVMEVLNRSAINRETGACVHYGLLDIIKGEGYKLSPRAKVLLNPVSEEERRENLVLCFKEPKLYSDLLDKYTDNLLPPIQQLKVILSRFHGITEAAAPQAAEVFISNAEYTGMLGKDRILRYSNLNQSEPVVNGGMGLWDQIPEAIDPPNSKNVVFENNTSPTMLLEEINRSVDITIRLSEKKMAFLKYPENINEKDIQILKLQLDQLALTI
jgi:hypothetical protein